MSYHPIRRLLHWTVALLVIATIPIGLVFTDFDNRAWADGAFGEGAFNTMYDLHKSIGVTILALMAARIGAKFVWPDPPHAAPLGPAQRIGSRSVHGLLYVLLIVAPLLGWAGVSAFPAPVPVFWLFEAPPLLSENRELSELLLEWHGAVALTIGALALVHIAAALIHRGVFRDHVFHRMAPPRS